MTSEEIQRLILADLMHGALDYWQIGADIGQAPFRIRAELKALKRERLVRDRLEPNRVAWELTNRGYELAFAAEQLTIRKESA